MGNTPGPEPAILSLSTLSGLFTTADAKRLGISDDQLRSKAVKRVMRGVYTIDLDPMNIVVRAKAALMIAGDGCLVCEATALRVLGVSLARTFASETDVHILARPGTCGPQMTGIAVHRSCDPHISFTEHDLPLLDPIDCWLQLAARASVNDLVVAADAMTRRVRPIVSRDEMAPLVQAATHIRGIRSAREAMEQSRPGTDSPMETRVRLALTASALPVPEVNHLVTTDSGPRRVAMAYLNARLAIDYDPLPADPAIRERDNAKRRELEDAGWRLITATSSDVRDPSSLARSVARTLGSAAPTPKRGL